jgi:hypothetical protein
MSQDAPNPVLSRESRRLLLWLELATAGQAGLFIGHFAFGARIYDDPSRYHVVVPAIIAFAITAGLAALYASRGGWLALWLLALAVAVPFVGVFGLYHGGFSHALKLLCFYGGMAPDRVESIFDSPDFAMPNDAVFEVSGLATLLVAGMITYLLVRVVHAARRPIGGASVAGSGRCFDNASTVK